MSDSIWPNEDHMDKLDFYIDHRNCEMLSSNATVECNATANHMCLFFFFVWLVAGIKIKI